MGAGKPGSTPQSASAERHTLAAAKLRQATARHGQGELNAAMAGYLEILELVPDHFDALHLLGVSHYQTGQAASAVELIQRAIALLPEQVAPYSNLGLAFQALQRPADALDSFSRGLRLDPNHIETLNNRGNTLNEMGRAADALTDFDRLLALKPDSAEAWSNRGTALLALGRHQAALDSHQQALQLRPDYPKALNNRGNVLRAMGLPAEALASFERALALRPDFVEALNNRGVTLRDMRRLEPALASLEHALQLMPHYVDALNNRGNVLRDLQRPAAALLSYQQALQLRPGEAQIWSNCGNALGDLHRHEEALASFERALTLDPDSLEALNNRANTLLALRCPTQALLSCEQALQLNPGSIAALNNRGNALMALDQTEAALDSYEQALQLAPLDVTTAAGTDSGSGSDSTTTATTLTNRSLALQQLGRYDAALAGFRQAARIQPDYAQAHWYEGLCRLLLGDFAAGWRLYEWRWQVAPFKAAQRDYPAPLWNGAVSLQGKTILLHAEQGLGDTLQFCRYVRQVAALGARIYFEVPAPLRALLEQYSDVARLFTAGESLPPFDYHCPLLSLPLAFHTELAGVPAPLRYLHADPVQIAFWQARLAHYPRPLIGLIWSGNTQHSNDRNRSIPLQQLAPWFAAQATFISLHNEIRATDRAACAAFGLIDFAEDLPDFSATAALAACLDQVIAVDTAGAHLAGALGLPTTLLLPQAPDFRWLLNRSDTPWYPTLRLIRQTAPGDWREAIAQVAAALGVA
jgi:tetratricopeptide (TPR) repeat protein